MPKKTSKRKPKQTKKTKKTKKPRKHLFWKILGIIIGVLFGLSILTTLIYRWVNPPITPLMVIRHNKNDYPIEKEWVPFDQISPYMPRAAIVSEDNFFLGHHGFDVIAIDDAIDERQSGKRKRGASSITQQTAKNVFLTPRRSWIRKGLEAYYTVLIEAFWSKERIMEVYLNVAEMGPGIYGVEAAAQHYFHCHASQLTAQQSATLLACFPDPLKRNPANPGPYVIKQANIIQQRMNTYGIPQFNKEYIKGTRARYKKAKKAHKQEY